MSNKRYLLPGSLDLKAELNNVKQNYTGPQNKKQASTIKDIKVKVFGTIVRVQNKHAPSNRIAISSIIVEQITKIHKKPPVFFAWCDVHGYGKFVPVKEVLAKKTGITMQLIECKKCLSAAKRKSSGSIFEKVFKIFRKGE